MGVAAFTDAWCELWVNTANDLGLDRGPSGSWAVVVRDETAATTEAITFRFDDGLLADAHLGSDGADVRLELPPDAFVNALAGDRSLIQRAVLSGTMRLTGDPDVLQALGPHMNGERFQLIATRVLEQTDFA